MQDILHNIGYPKVRISKNTKSTAKKTESVLDDCERRELPSQSYGTPKKRNKILNIGLRIILYKTFSYSFSILITFLGTFD